MYCFQFFKSINFIGSDQSRYCVFKSSFLQLTAIVAQLARAADL